MYKGKFKRIENLLKCFRICFLSCYGKYIVMFIYLFSQFPVYRYSLYIESMFQMLANVNM